MRKSGNFAGSTLAAVALALAIGAGWGAGWGGQAVQALDPTPPAYNVAALGTLGGSFSIAEGVSNRGWVSGSSTLPGDTLIHATVWRNGVLTDLGLAGLNSQIAYPFNEQGEAAVLAEIAAPDPMGEDFCAFGTHLGCRPTVWQNGVLRQLPTLGGNNGHAGQVNNSGEVVGVSETTRRDTTCAQAVCLEGMCPFQVFETQAVVWKNGVIQKLPTVAGDPDGDAVVINDDGHVAGTSGRCIGSATEALHIVLWANGTVTDLGNLGGTTNNHPQYINNRDDVVGYSNLPGDQTSHAFLWNKGVMKDLGTLPGDFLSEAQAISDTGLVGGVSCDSNFNCHAFLWQNGIMTDANTLIPADSGLFLVNVLSINSLGEFAGLAVRLNDGALLGYLAVPNQAGTASGGTAQRSARAPGQLWNSGVRANLRRFIRARRGAEWAAATPSQGNPR